MCLFNGRLSVSFSKWQSGRISRSHVHKLSGVCTRQTNERPTHKQLHSATSHYPRVVLGIRTCSKLSYSMSHSAHFVTSLNISGKQDVQKAHSGEQAILGMKMKKLENMLLMPQSEVSHHLLTIFSGSFSTSDESQGKWTTEQEEGAGVGYGSQKTHLRTGCNTGAPKSTPAPREYPQKMSSLSLLLQRLAVKDISSGRSFTHCHCFIRCG